MMFARRYLPSITGLQALEAVARLGTASAAAAELSLTQGAVSRALQTVEAQLGAPVLLRERQRISLTQGGRDYVEEVRRALKILGDAAVSLRANPAGGNLNLAILPAFGMHWLTPRLPRFAAAHPEVTVNLTTRLRPFDLAASGIDAAIHYGRADWPGAAFLKLMDEKVIAVAAPSLLPAPLANAAEALALPLLGLDSRPGDWGRWLAEAGLPDQRPTVMRFDQFATMAQAARHGMGAAILPTFLVSGDLAAGRLRPVFGGPQPAAGAYHLVGSEAAPPRAPLQSFLAWLRAELAQAASDDGGLTDPRAPAQHRQV
jgi:LysR family transcriptional regulator, glycine cleavage system transcriptional activator